MEKRDSAITNKEDKMRYIKNGDLQDDEIIASIYMAANEYENGEVMEARDRMLEIIAAIDEYVGPAD